MIRPLRLAWRSLTRSPRRTLLTATALANAVAGGLLFYGFTRDTYWGLAEVFARAGNGHVQIADAAWFDAPAPERHRVARATLDALRNALAADPDLGPMLLAGSPRRHVVGMLAASGRSGVFLGTATDPTVEPVLAPMAKPLAGAPLDAAAPDGVLLGEPLAARLGVKPGDTVTALVTTDLGLTNAMDLKVAGVSRTGAEELDRAYVSMPLDTALSLVDGSVADVLVLALKETGDTDAALVAARRVLARPEFAGLAARPWYDRATYYIAVRALYDRIFGVFEGLMALVTVLSLSHAVAAVVAERRAEISMLRVVGLKRRDVAALFVAEGALLGALGSALGVAVAHGIALLTRELGGIPMPPPPGFTFGYDAQFRIDPLGYAIVLPVTMLATVVASLVPALRASRGQLSRGLAGLAILLVALPADAAAPSVGPALPADERCVLDLRVEDAEGAMSWRLATFGGDTLAVATSLPEGKRQVVLRAGDATWFMTEAMKAPMRVGLAQRVLGQLSLADVVDPRQLAGWEVVGTADGVVTAVARAGAGLAWDRAEFEVAADGRVSAARFAGPSGKTVRTTAYRYDGARLAEVIVTDAARPGSPTRLVPTAPRCVATAWDVGPDSMLRAARALAAEER